MARALPRTASDKIFEKLQKKFLEKSEPKTEEKRLSRKEKFKK